MNDVRRKWFDSAINIPTLLTIVSMVGGAWIYVTNVYGGIDHRIGELESRTTKVEYTQADMQQHFARVEAAQANDRQDTRDRLNDLQKSINDVNGKLDTMHDQLIMNSAGSRPETRRWTK